MLGLKLNHVSKRGYCFALMYLHVHVLIPMLVWPMTLAYCQLKRHQKSFIQERFDILTAIFFVMINHSQTSSQYSQSSSSENNRRTKRVNECEIWSIFCEFKVWFIFITDALHTLSYQLTSPWPIIIKSSIRIFTLDVVIDGWGISCEIALRWMPRDLTDDRSMLVLIICCR